MFSVYIFYLCIGVLLQLKQCDRISVPPDYIKTVFLHEHVTNLLKKINDLCHDDTNNT